MAQQGAWTRSRRLWTRPRRSFPRRTAARGGAGVKVVYGDGFDQLREKIGLDVEQAVEGPGPMDRLLRIVGRQPAATMQIGPLVVVRFDGQFSAALLGSESDMDDCHARRLLDRPEVALAWLNKPPPAYHFDLAPVLAEAPASDAPVDEP
jgi:hypothetical protein